MHTLGVLISGGWGYGNIGDDAILLALHRRHGDICFCYNTSVAKASTLLLRGLCV